MRNNVLFSKRLVEMVVYFCNSLSEIKGDLSERDSDLHHIYCPRWLIICATFSGQQRQSVSNSLMPLSSCQVGVYNIISVSIIIIYKKNNCRIFMYIIIIIINVVIKRQYFSC